MCVDHGLHGALRKCTPSFPCCCRQEASQGCESEHRHAAARLATGSWNQSGRTHAAHAARHPCTCATHQGAKFLPVLRMISERKASPTASFSAICKRWQDREPFAPLRSKGRNWGCPCHVCTFSMAAYVHSDCRTTRGCSFAIQRLLHSRMCRVWRCVLPAGAAAASGPPG